MNNQIINKIKNELDIVDIVSEYVDLSKKGRNFWGVCPFHEDTNPSMSVSPDKQLFKCFVCQKGGDLIKFISEIKQLPFKNAIEILAKKVGIDFKVSTIKRKIYSSKEEKLIKIHKDAMDFFQYSLSTEEGKVAREYINKRNLNQSLIETFFIGYAPKFGLKDYLISKGHDEADIINSSLINNHNNDFFKNRLIFGIKNDYGDIVSFSARDLSGNASAKYINSAETAIFNKNSILYNFFNVKNLSSSSNKTVFINEGFMDVIAMFRAGIKNSVAIMGTALTNNHAKKLQNYRVILMLDGDAAGIAATLKSIKVLLDNNIDAYVIKNESCYDPDEILSQFGVEKLIQVTSETVSALEYIFDLHKEKYKTINPDEMKKFIDSFCKYLKKADDFTIEFYINKLSEYFNIEKNIIKSLFKTHNLLSNSNKYNKNKINNIKEKNETSILNSNLSLNKNKEAFRMIKSMIKNKSLVNVYEKNTPYIYNTLLKSIASMLLSNYKYSRNEKPLESMAKKINEINECAEYTTDENGFIDLLKKVTKESYVEQINLINVKYNMSKDLKEKENLLNKVTKLIKESKKRE